MSNGLSCHAEFNTSISKWILKTRRNLVPYFCWKVLVTQWKTKQDTFCIVPRNILHSKYSNNKSLAPRFSHIMYAYYKAVTTCASCTDEHKKKQWEIPSCIHLNLDFMNWVLYKLILFEAGIGLAWVFENYRLQR